MKPVLLIVLALSLAGNVLLSLQVARQPEAPSAAVPLGPRAKNDVSTASSAKAAARPDEAVTTSGSSLQWPAIAGTNDLPGLVARLRAAGFPPAVVRMIVNQQIELLYAGRNPMTKRPYWNRNMSSTPEETKVLQEIRKEREDLYRSLLGPEARPSVTMNPDLRERRYGSLSNEKVDAIEAINRDYGSLISQVHSGRPADQQAMQERQKQQKFLQEEQRKDIVALLTPEELEQWDLRSSPSAGQVMGRLERLEVNEAEYIALYRQQKAFDDTYPSLTNGPLAPEMAAARAAGQEQLIQNARTVLTDDRFYEYLKGIDGRYNQTASFAAKYPTITPATTYQLYQLERSAQATLGRVSPGLSADQRREQLQTLANDFTARVQSLVGPQIAEAYINQGVGRMIKQMSRPSPPGTVPAVQLPGTGGG